MKKKRAARTALRFLEAAGIRDIVLPAISMRGFDDLIIENHGGIEMCESECVRVQTPCGAVEIRGSDLSIGQLARDDIAVHGRIESMAFMRK